jgi:glycosyltransferase involved in cell wall biosynthesis
MDALARAGHRVQLASTFRTYDGDGDEPRQRALRAQGEALAGQYADEWLSMNAAARPELWFTYHLYYKAPDYLGPGISQALGIPYVVAEASYAAKRAHGAWALGHEATAAAIRKAALVISPSRDDMAGLLQLIDETRILHLPPFLDPAPYAEARAKRAGLRAELAAKHKLESAVPWIAVVAMMRKGDKLASYRVLAAALSQLASVQCRVLVVGDGPERGQVEKLFDARALFFGALGQQRIAELLTVCDLYAWPAVNEAYGMALLEAQAAGVPVVAAATRGVPDIVRDGQTGTLVPYGDEKAFAAAVCELLSDGERRAALGREAARYVAAERSLDAAALRLQTALAAL